MLSVKMKTIINKHFLLGLLSGIIFYVLFAVSDKISTFTILEKIAWVFAVFPVFISSFIKIPLIIILPLYYAILGKLLFSFNKSKILMPNNIILFLLIIIHIFVYYFSISMMNAI